MFADNTMRYRTRMTVARHGYETVATHLNEHYGYYHEMLQRHGVQITNQRITNDLRKIAAAGDDVRLVRAALAAGGSLHTVPADLAHTLAELDRLLSRLEQAQTSTAS